MTTTLSMTPHKDYLLMQPNIKSVRDCIEGEPAIKRANTKYLKHPNMIDQTSPQQVARYNAYLDGAEFDEYPATTLSSMLGQMTSGEIEINLPEKLQYLENDVDGDGMPLAGAAEFIFSNLIQVKFHILLAEYKGLANIPNEQISIADVKQQNPRAVVKMYNRESLIDWDFRHVNGRKQLSLMVLVEESTSRDENLKITDNKSYLIVALDEGGFYYQQKLVTNKTEIRTEGERVYIADPSGAKLKWIPAEIVIDEEWPAGSLPRRPGFIYPTCQMSLYRYRVSADYKEALRFFGPTGFSGGWKDGDMELFEKINGRDYIAYGIGITNCLPDGVDHEIKGMDIQTESFERYFDSNDKRARAVGAIINDPAEGADVTATKSIIDNKNSTAVMSMIVKNTEASLRRVILYCGMFEGLWSQDAIEQNLDKVTLVLPKEFIAVDMSLEEVNSVVTAYNSALISRDEAVRKLVAGGFTVSKIEQILAELESQSVTPLANNNQQL